ncbi:MAG TPA: ankyrin repeat domain-containing protein [Bacilli bacterium]|nr:MAG: Ankyrin repeats (3 copies) [Tenericutes bacterium ADurb.BinA124]HNZ50452.1 ankyrin repeat domain-containing protein [Bacilli bacterium]HOH17938.1 ankyrin repeat domain-containing protein [Bacilli bacterium]HPX83792.1 ankyrin repeat domain-containing protein [Bacilli bacterium]HQC73905.1 ankyrin repeat domain-containing protein [Bacilli bacterium]
MNKRGAKKRFKDFVDCIKQDPHRYLYIKNMLWRLQNDGFDLNTQGYGGKTLLHLALKLNNLRLMNLFLSFGVNPNLADEQGNAPLHVAVLANQMRFIKGLVAHACDINLACEQEQSPLHLAVINGNLEVVKYLIENGADIMIQDELHNYPLDYAIEEKDDKILRYLLTKQEIDDERKRKILTIINKAGEKQ